MKKCEKCGIEYPSEIDFHRGSADGPLICIQCHRSSGGPQEGDPVDDHPPAKNASDPPQREGLWEYVFHIVLCMLFLVVVLWYGPKYFFKGEYLKAAIIIGIVVTEIIVALRWL